jgi:mannose-6-phosphate isomerase-like protein (cupin superfamily)
MSYKTNIENKTIQNNYYRNVLYTNNNMQLVLMNLLPKQEIGMEKHNGSQFIRVEKGNGIAIVKNKRYYLSDGSALVIDANTNHNIIAGKNGMKLYSIYTPPQHDTDVKARYKEI